MVGSVLVVEGNELVRGLTVEILQDNGFTVAGAPTLASAFDQLAADPDDFDVLLIDTNLPDGNGLDFTAALRELRFTRPIIATSGSCREIRRATECGASAWMQKPFSVSSLVRVVNAAARLHANHTQGTILRSLSQPPLFC